MSCSSLGAHDFLKMNSPINRFDSQFGNDENKSMEACSYEDTQIDKLKTFPDESDGTNQTLDLFKRYRPLVKPEFDNGQRKPTLLENSLLTRFSPDLTTPSLARDKGVKAQLTIFYGGQINVYNDVPFEKAHAIMLLAGENSLSAPVVTNLPEEEVKKAVQNQQNLPSYLPIARKFSLKRFLEKRRDRITSNAPYPSPETKHDKVANGDDHQTASEDNESNERSQKSPLVLTPFPSRLGNSF